MSRTDLAAIAAAVLAGRGAWAVHTRASQAVHPLAWMTVFLVQDWQAEDVLAVQLCTQQLATVRTRHPQRWVMPCRPSTSPR